MADISSITLPNGDTYNIKDTVARQYTGTVKKVSTGAGLTGGDITTSGTIKANLKSETKSTLTAAAKGSTANREYAVGLDANGDLSVNIPWENSSAVTGVKGDSESTYRTGNVNITKANIGLGSVENKSSATIRGEITKSNVTTALGYTPYTPAEVDALVSAVFHYKGTKATYAEVAALTDMKTGDVWQVTADNSEYVYNGSAWEKLGPTIDLSGYLTSVSVAGQTLTPGSNTITATQLKTALGLNFGTVGSEGNPVYFNDGTPEPIAFTFSIDEDNNMNVSWDGDAPEPVIPTGTALAIESGGTGATTAADARTNLGLGSAATYNVVSSVNDDSNLVTGGAIKRYYEAVGIPSAICTTSSATASKVATCSSFSLLAKSYIQVILANENIAESSLTLNINDTGTKPIMINGEASSSSNYTLPAGAYFVYYDGSAYYFRTDGKITADITGNAATATYADSAGTATSADYATTANSATTASTASNAGNTLKVNNHTVEKDVPSDAVFTDTTALASMTGTLGVDHGGTGQTSLQATRNAMGLGNTTGALPVANGGTGATNAEDARTNLGLEKYSMVWKENFWLGTTLIVWRSGRTITAVWRDTMNATSSSGSKAQYVNIGTEYAPPTTIRTIAFDQNGKRFLFDAKTNGEVGVYYQLDAVTSPTNVYGVLTWSY